MPRGGRDHRLIPGSPAARRREPVTILTVYENGPFWTHNVLPLVWTEAAERGWKLLRGWHVFGWPPQSMQIDGALSDCGSENAMVRDLLDAGCPLVMLGVSAETGHTGLPSVLHDSAAEGRLAAEHLHKCGFRNVGSAWQPRRGRLDVSLDSFFRRAEALGMECVALRFRLKTRRSRVETYRDMQRQFTDWVSVCPRPLGLFAPSDYRAAQYCQWLGEAGIVVPTQVAVLGRGNEASICECTLPTLSSVCPDREGQVRAACDLLAGMIAGRTAPEQPIMVAPQVIAERESTNVLATSDPRVAAALRFMWDHLDRDLSVDDIAREAGTSRRTLDRAFRTHLKRGVNAELRRKRLEVFRDLLVFTREPIAELAPAAGFRTMVHLQRSFRRVYGMSPRQYRRQHTKQGA